MNVLRLCLLLFVGTVAAQTANVTPSGVSWFDSVTEVDVRLKGPATPSDPFPTVRLIKSKFAPLNAASFTYNVPCWNASKSCPQVIAVTVRVFLNLPTGRVNVTRYTGLCGSQAECVLPFFPAIAANAGESYHFNYSVAKASWVEPPSIVVK